MSTALTGQRTITVKGPRNRPLNIIVDPDFERLIPPLSADEFRLLKESIKERGVTSPLRVWGDVQGKEKTYYLLDGHHRLKAFQELEKDEDLEVSTRAKIRLEWLEWIEVQVDSRADAELWIEENQAGRRNLTDDQRAVIWDSIRERRSKIARATQLQEARDAKDSVSSETDDTGSDRPPKPKQDTRKQIAAEAKIPENKLKTVARLKKTAPEKLQEVRAGRTTLRQAAAAVSHKSTESKTAPTLPVELEIMDALDDFIKNIIQQFALTSPTEAYEIVAEICRAELEALDKESRKAQKQIRTGVRA